MKTPATWRTKSGKVIPIAEMEDGHLLNTIRLLQRTYARVCLTVSLEASGYAATAPDGAAMAAESEADQLMEEAEEQENIGKEYPSFFPLLTEAARRGLDLLPLERFDNIPARVLLSQYRKRVPKLCLAKR
jgi:hypothetical protein